MSVIPPLVSFPMSPKELNVNEVSNINNIVHQVVQHINMIIMSAGNEDNIDVGDIATRTNQLRFEQFQLSFVRHVLKCDGLDKNPFFVSTTKMPDPTQTILHRGRNCADHYSNSDDHYTDTDIERVADVTTMTDKTLVKPPSLLTGTMNHINHLVSNVMNPLLLLKWYLVPTSSSLPTSDVSPMTYYFFTVSFGTETDVDPTLVQHVDDVEKYYKNVGVCGMCITMSSSISNPSDVTINVYHAPGMVLSLNDHDSPSNHTVLEDIYQYCGANVPGEQGYYPQVVACNEGNVNYWTPFYISY